MYRGALGKDWKRRNEVKRRGGRGRRGVKEKNFPPFLNFSGQDMVYVHISLPNSLTPFHLCISHPIPSHQPK